MKLQKLHHRVRDIFKIKNVPSLACSNCFQDHGLRLDAEQIGKSIGLKCANCGSTSGRLLSTVELNQLAHRFFVIGSTKHFSYGSAPVIQFNEHQETSVEFSCSLANDIKVFERVLGVGFFYYGPRFWMFGEIEPLKALQKTASRHAVIERILNEYPVKTVDPSEVFYRVRKAPKAPSNENEYDSPPSNVSAIGRFNSRRIPILYASPDLEVCVHETRATAEDELYVAALKATRSLRLLNLSAILEEEKHVTEFESLDLSVNFLFLAAKHSYLVSRKIATASRDAGFDGIVYPSYFSRLRTGSMPIETAYGLSTRQIVRFKNLEASKAVPNFALFGHPLKKGLVSVHSINKLILRKVSYDFHFGPSAY